MKYIIEVEDESTEGLYRAKGFETLVFNEAGLKKLEPVSDALQHGYDEGYQEGLNDGWELAKKIVLPTRTQHDAFTCEDLNSVFGVKCYENVMSRYSASEAIAKIKEYEDSQKKAKAEIKVGDEVDDGVGLAVIIGIRDDGTYDGIADTGGHVYITKVHKKTGRHFPQIEEVVKQMKGE